ncbi:MAG: DUF4249 domain-containing protein [Hymenobacteraceae bacterium]|nr:DUF4249 domain-containing protein [Hymenobacteraceae bacterium]MDX5395899.1 DUF4249 domain-containing protein [Hymenobacteraceae bacterium]MDX5443008.1 DUF4249 domain-containing protein [Hymenobacteraceae bacterium]MDX5511954.1 DUF4249 domain-containing protein [Hymenobacteraceae bacterium]
MKNKLAYIKTALFGLLMLPLLSSCEEVIDYELRKGDEKVVVEGWIYDTPGPYTVRLSNTKAYLENGGTTGINGATVIISDNEGHVDTLQQVQDGLYQTTSLQSKIGNTYYLKAVSNGEIYTAQSTLLPVNPIDSIVYEFKEGNGRFEKGYYPTMFITDPAGKGNHYLFNVYINGARDKNLAVLNDDYYDGNSGEVFLNYTLQQGDTFRVDVLSLDKAAYDFYLGLAIMQNYTGGPFDSPPANAPSNISNGGIGFFGAASIKKKEIVIK